MLSIGAMNTFKDRLAYALTETRTTQSELADKLDLTRSAVNLWLSDDKERRTEPRLKTMYLVGDALGIDADWLAKGVGELRIYEPKKRAASHWDHVKSYIDSLPSEIVSPIHQDDLATKRLRIRYGNNKKTGAAEKSLIYKVKEIFPDAVRYFDAGFDVMVGGSRRITFDFLSPYVIAEIRWHIKGQAVRVPALESSLYRLSVAARLDRGMHIRRRHVMIVICLDEDANIYNEPPVYDPDENPMKVVQQVNSLASEAALLDVEVYRYTLLDNVIELLLEGF